MNARSRPETAPRSNAGTESSTRRDLRLSFRLDRSAPGRHWWEHPEDLTDDQLMLVVRSMAAVDRAVDRHRRAA
jgi:hypothetical protein